MSMTVGYCVVVERGLRGSSRPAPPNRRGSPRWAERSRSAMSWSLEWFRMANRAYAMIECRLSGPLLARLGAGTDEVRISRPAPAGALADSDWRHRALSDPGTARDLDGPGLERDRRREMACPPRRAAAQ